MNLFDDRGLPTKGRRGLKSTTHAMIRGVSRGLSKSNIHGRRQAAARIRFARKSQRQSAQYRTGRNITALREANKRHPVHVYRRNQLAGQLKRLRSMGKRSAAKGVRTGSWYKKATSPKPRTAKQIAASRANGAKGGGRRRKR